MRIILVIVALFLAQWKTPQNEKVQPTAVSHQIWDGLLKKYVSSSGKVNYSGIKAEKAKLQTYLDVLSKGISSSAPRNEAMAFWINAYNAFTVKLIIDNYPVSSIKKLKGGKPWDSKFIKIGGQSYSLNQIEHEILRKKYFDPRLHFVLVCAAKSCPKLLNKAFTPANVFVEMDKQARYFINNTSKNKISASSVQVSQLFNWYKGDFTKKGSLIAYINKYANTKANTNAKVSYQTYDWALNDNK